MTGKELQSARNQLALSRPALALLTGLHPDTIKYWERKSTVDLRGYAPDRLLQALGLGHISQRDIFPGREPKQQWGYFPTPARAGGGVLVANGKWANGKQCGALTRKGTACRSKAINGKGRCKFHGGMSTGPKTPEGRERIAEAQRRRWANRSDIACAEGRIPDR